MRIVLDLQACQASSMNRGIGRYSMALALAMARNSGAHDLRIVLNQDYPDTVEAIRKAFDGLVPQSRWGEMISLQGVKMRRASRIHMRITADAADAIVWPFSVEGGTAEVQASERSTRSHQAGTP